MREQIIEMVKTLNKSDFDILVNDINRIAESRKVEEMTIEEERAYIRQETWRMPTNHEMWDMVNTIDRLICNEKVDTLEKTIKYINRRMKEDKLK